MTLNLQRISDIDQINANTEAKPPEKKSSAQIKAEFVKGIMDRINGDDFESEEERQAFENKIQQKIKNGAKLSAKEMAYIRRTNPYIYQQVVRVQQRREALKEQLRHCRTKEEAQQVMSNAMTSISDKDPARDAMIAAVQNVSQQFRESEAYQKLPETEEGGIPNPHVLRAMGMEESLAKGTNALDKGSTLIRKPCISVPSLFL